MLATDTCDILIASTSQLVTDNYLADSGHRCQSIEPQYLPSERPLLQDVRKSGAVGTSRFLLQDTSMSNKSGLKLQASLSLSLSLLLACMGCSPCPKGLYLPFARDSLYRARARPRRLRLSFCFFLSPGLGCRGVTPYTTRACAPDSCEARKFIHANGSPSLTSFLPSFHWGQVRERTWAKAPRFPLLRWNRALLGRCSRWSVSVGPGLIPAPTMAVSLDPQRTHPPASSNGRHLSPRNNTC